MMAKSAVKIPHQSVKLSAKPLGDSSYEFRLLISIHIKSIDAGGGCFGADISDIDAVYVVGAVVENKDADITEAGSGLQRGLSIGEDMALFDKALQAVPKHKRSVCYRDYDDELMPEISAGKRENMLEFFVEIMLKLKNIVAISLLRGVIFKQAECFFVKRSYALSAVRAFPFARIIYGMKGPAAGGYFRDVLIKRKETIQAPEYIFLLNETSHLPEE
jgi:hypothetical protein